MRKFSTETSLIAIPGPHDPFFERVVGEGLEAVGPVMQWVRERRPPQVILVGEIGDEVRLNDLKETIGGELSSSSVSAISINSSTGEPGTGCDGTILTALRSSFPDQEISAGQKVSIVIGSTNVALVLNIIRACEDLELSIESVSPAAGSALRSGVARATGSASRHPANFGSMLREPRSSYGDTSSGSAGGTSTMAPEEAVRKVCERLGIVGTSSALRETIGRAFAVAQHAVPVLVEGETGTGKSMFARLIHELSPCVAGPLVSVNCAAIPETLVESHLFGHQKGAFTGANADSPGKFELADGGTLFLDEIGELPLTLQPKLLTVLDNGIVERVGASTGRQVSVRIIAATNRDMKQELAEGRFREDLFYRISYASIRLPPLRERRTDIPELAEQILTRLNMSLRSPRRLNTEAIERLQSLPWQGNVRDLEHVIGRSVMLSPNAVLGADDLVILQRDPGGLAWWSALPELYEGFSIEDFLAGTRKQLVLRALEQSGGNQSAAARLLGITPQAVSKFVKSQGS
jgi:DNA-binding NtrC family response regulator